jgi:CheY-like chemotaxis protein
MASQQRILIVQDSEPGVANILLDSMTRFFKMEGYVVHGVEDGQQALDSIGKADHEKFDPDLVITDLQMPNMDGAALCQRLRVHTEYAKIPIILLTTHEKSNSRVQEACALENVRYVPKTGRVALLLEAVHDALAGKELS